MAYTVGGSAADTTVGDGRQRRGSRARRGVVILVAEDVDLQAAGGAAQAARHRRGRDARGAVLALGPGRPGYEVFTSPVTGGGYAGHRDARCAAPPSPSPGCGPASTYHIVVGRVDRAGNSRAALERSHGHAALPDRLGNLQYPPTLTHTISAVTRTDAVYGQVLIDGVTSAAGRDPDAAGPARLRPGRLRPDGNAAWTWVDATFNADAGNNDEFSATLLPDATGSLRLRLPVHHDRRRDWVYADLDGITNGYSPAQAGALTVNASSDTTAPAAPARAGRRHRRPVRGASSPGTRSPAIRRLRSTRSQRAPGGGGDLAVLGDRHGTGYTDTAVTGARPTRYRVLAVDTSFNRSAPSVLGDGDRRDPQGVGDLHA